MAIKCDEFTMYLMAFTDEELDTITYALYHIGEDELADEIKTQIGKDREE